MSGVIALTHFIFSLFFSIVILSLWLRLILRYFHISVINPVSQLIYKLTNPLVNPIQNLIKHQYQSAKKYDTPAFITLIGVELLKIVFMGVLTFHSFISIPSIFIYVIADLIIQPCDILFLAILIRVIMSFVNPNWQGPIADFLRSLTEPLLKLGRRIVPAISGFDFSPFIIMVVLKMITLFINASLPWRL